MYFLLSYLLESLVFSSNALAEMCPQLKETLKLIFKPTKCLKQKLPTLCNFVIDRGTFKCETQKS